MSFDREAAIASLDQEGSAPEGMEEQSQGDSAPDSGNLNTSEAPDSGTEQAVKDLLDLDGIEKFKLDGKEWTRDDLKKSILMHSDYTKKTQSLAEQKKSWEQEKSFHSNLAADLVAVSKNPNLVRDFKQVYPKEFHSLVEQLTPSQQAQVAQSSQQSQLPPEWADKFSEMQSTLQEWKNAQMESAIQAEEAQLASRAERMLSQYKYANETEVLSYADAMRRQKAELGMDPQLNEQEWEKLWKSSHDHINKLVTGSQSQRVQAQREANKRGKDGGSGGGIPGAEPKQHKTLKEAAEALKHTLGI